jgi:hypothetical protein
MRPWKLWECRHWYVDGWWDGSTEWNRWLSVYRLSTSRRKSPLRHSGEATRLTRKKNIRAISIVQELNTRALGKVDFGMEREQLFG